MKATVLIVLAAAPLLWGAAAGASGRVTIQTGLPVGTAPCEPAAGVQLAAEWQARSETSAEKHRRQTSDQDVDLDVDESPADSHHKLMPGQKPGISVTGSPSGYDAKRLNRLWGRFNGAKPSAKAERVHKSNGGDAAVRPGRWAR